MSTNWKPNAVTALSAPERSERPSGVLKGLLRRTIGKAYDRAPCPHTLVTWDEVPDPQRPDDLHRRRARSTLVVCERPADHVRESSTSARLHSGPGEIAW